MPINNDTINLVGNFNAQSVEINFEDSLMFICMQKTNFIFNVFFWDIVKTLQICYFGGTLGMLNNPHKNHTINL